GGGLLVLLMIAPGGLGELFYALRDRLLRLLAARRGLSVPSLAEHPVFEDAATAEGAAEIGAAGPPPDVTEELPTGSLVISCEDVDASYGQIQVLFGVDLQVQDGEM